MYYLKHESPHKEKTGRTIYEATGFGAGTQYPPTGNEPDRTRACIAERGAGNKNRIRTPYPCDKIVGIGTRNRLLTDLFIPSQEKTENHSTYMLSDKVYYVNTQHICGLKYSLCKQKGHQSRRDGVPDTPITIPKRYMT